MVSGASMITAERYRQVMDEGFTADHDDMHGCGDLLSAGICYAKAAEFMTNRSPNEWEQVAKQVPDEWPWDPSWWKPDADPIRNLVKAGALIAAEIDRQERQL